MIKTIIKIFFLALITVGVLAFFIKTSYDKAIESPNSEDTKTVEFTVKEGNSVNSIITDLVDAGLLKENWINYVKVYLKLNNLSSKIQAGTYNIPKNLSIKELIETIQHAEYPSIWVTLPEGLRKDEIADILGNEFSNVGNSKFSKSQFISLTEDKAYIQTLGLAYDIDNLEGFLYPDKYAFAQDSDTKIVLETLIDNFKRKIGTNVTYKDLIVASMLEREGYNEQDRAIIADIIERRNEEGWLLQIDATLLYPLKDWKHNISDTDKASDSPYNTYKKLGFPPTPICNPGLQSIQAAMNPQANTYYFYIHDKNGNAYYAETLAEHNRNIQQYLK